MDIFRSTIILISLICLLSMVTVAGASAPAVHTEENLTLSFENRSVSSAQIQNIAAVSTGQTHTCALTDDGGVKCWGDNSRWQLGRRYSVTSSVPVDVEGLTENVTAIASGAAHNCALTTSGSVKCWGENSNGQLGNGTNINSYEPVLVSGLTGIKAISSEFNHTCALTAIGKVKCWGYNNFGQLGDGTRIDRNVPVDVSGLTEEGTFISTSYSHSCVVTVTGSAKCWGYNYYRQLGDSTTIDRLTPVAVLGLPEPVKELYTGAAATYALGASGAVLAWGNVSVDGREPVVRAPTYMQTLGSPVTVLDEGSDYTCAVITEGVKCWGVGFALRTGRTFSSFQPASVDGLTAAVRDVTVGKMHACALLTNSQVKCWGSNHEGQLGNGHAIQQIVPFHVTGLDGEYVDVAAGNAHTCALNSRGEVLCCGDNSNDGVLGNGTIDPSGTPVQVIGLPGPVKSITAGGGHTCVLLASSGVMCWGSNWNGQVDGTGEYRRTPVYVPSLTSGMKSVTAGSSHSCAITNAGVVKCWGLNSRGQLGRAPASWASFPPGDVVGLSTSAIAVTARGNHTCVLTITNNVKCWGANDFGQLGNGTTSDSTLPVSVSGLTGVKAIAAGDFSTCALLIDGKIKCWGNGYQSTPVEIDAVPADPVSISVGNGHHCTAAGGKALCWGYNSHGQLGDGTGNWRMLPVTVFRLSQGVTKVTAGQSHTCALVNKQVMCWGSDADGQLGLGNLSSTYSPVVVVSDVTPIMHVDYSRGRPGSFFTVVGENFVPDSILQLDISGNSFISDLQTDFNGRFILSFNSYWAVPGGYLLKVREYPSAFFMLVVDTSAGLHNKESECQEFMLPPGMAIPLQFFFLPVVGKR